MIVNNSRFYYFNAADDFYLASQAYVNISEEKHECADLLTYIGSFDGTFDIFEVGAEEMLSFGVSLSAQAGIVDQIVRRYKHITAYAHIFDALSETYKKTPGSLVLFVMNLFAEGKSVDCAKSAKKYGIPEMAVRQLVDNRRIFEEIYGGNIIKKSDAQACLNFIYENLGLCKKYKLSSEERVYDFISSKIDKQKYAGFAVDGKIICITDRIAGSFYFKKLGPAA